MAFVNEKIPKADKEKITSVINFEKLSTLARWIPRFSPPMHWTINRDKDVYLIDLVGGGRDQYPYCVLGIDGQIVIFNVHRRGEGNDTIGIKSQWDVYDLLIPAKLEFRKEEIKQLIREGLEEMAYFRPLNDGGTWEMPNTTTRGNIISFNVEFK